MNQRSSIFFYVSIFIGLRRKEREFLLLAC